ncbi:MAG: ThiF family adenylyltransferase [Burkholderiaceae bacterium]
MTAATLVVPDSVQAALNAILHVPVETAGVLLASVVKTRSEDLRLLAREFVLVQDEAYLRRDGAALCVASEGYVAALARAEQLGAMAIWVHTHPGLDAVPAASEHDLLVDEQLAETFRVRSGSELYGALILSPRAKGLAFTGHIATAGGARSRIERMWLVGDRFRVTSAWDSSSTVVSEEMYDRNVRAMGGAVQSTLCELRVGVVGCGGTGSAVAEQLVRLGVRNFVLVDPDTLSVSNITRVYGSGAEDVGRLKVEVLRDHLRRIAPDATCTTVASMLTVVSSAEALIGVDVIFGCTDDNAGRLILSRFPAYLFTPVIDCGVLISSASDGLITGIDARVTTVVPESACLMCRGRIDVARAGAELMSPSERVRLESEGYAPALGQVEPSVVTFTTLTAATAVSELLERLVGFGPDVRPGEVLLRCHEREMSTNIASPRPGHYCSASSGKLGLGVTDPLLELAWGA